MKKMKVILLVLFVSFFLTIHLYGQNDSVKTDLNLSGEVLKKLDNKDIVAIIKYRERIAMEEMAKQAKAPSTLSTAIYIIIVFSFCLMMVVLPFYFNFQKAKGRQLIINNLIDKGKEIPEELIAPSTRSGRSDLHKGIILIALGLSISVVLFLLNIAHNYWTAGLIPLFIGVGYLISHKFDNPD
jgi:hypothetical protein